MSKEHHYELQIKWTGNRGTGTSGYKEYDRSHSILVNGKVEILASSDAPFMGDITKHNPEDLLVASISSCHMLWYLHLCADAGIIVVDYVDNPTGILEQVADGSGKFTQVVLHPMVTVTDASMLAKAVELHTKAHHYCFIANSVNFDVYCEPTSVVA